MDSNTETVKVVEDVKQKSETQEISERFERLKKTIEELHARYEVIQNEGVRNDLSNTIISAVTAFDKVSDPEVKRVAKGLALAAIGKLHIEIDKI
jgi:archaellum component FlaC